MVIQMRAVDAREVAVGERLRQIEADDFGTERRIERVNVETLRRILLQRRACMGGLRRGTRSLNGRDH